LKVCIVVPYDLAREGGVKKHSVHLAQALRQLGDEVEVIGPSSAPPPEGDGLRAVGGVVDVVSNGSAAHIGLFAPPWRVFRLVRARRYDVVHLQEPLVPALNYWALFSAGRAARVCTFHSFDEEAGADRARRLGARIAYPRIDRGIAVSPAAERHARVAWRGRLSLIPNGVPTSVFVPPEWAGSASDEPLRLLFVGHFRSARKGLPHLVAAYRRLRERGIAVTLDVVGEGAPGTPLETAPGLTYHGPIASEEALARRYAACDLFVAPATGQESFGIVLLEAMAAGRPVICSDIEGYRHVVGEAGGARLVHPGEVAALEAAIAELAADPAKRCQMGALNRARAAAYDWLPIARRVRAEYLAAIEQRRARLAGFSPLHG
jgi:phosphatidylinositol alpha-mannosyltransferase